MYFSSNLPEISDYAANSILIQSAKHFQLFHGHYSRLEFFHPGPAFLQVQAFGELLLHDVLGLVPSQLGGQMIGALALNCILLWLLFSSVKDVDGLLDGAIFKIAFIACLLWSIPGMISGFWMPYLYVLPFSCYVYALALLSMNKLRSSREKVILFVSLGLLIHGHSSFIGLTVIGFLISIICGFCSRHFNFRSMLSAVTNIARPRFILLIPALFLAPIVIDMFVNFPGEVPSYFDYAMKVVRNDFIESVRFSLTFFPGGRRMVPFFAGACVMSYFWARQIPLRCSQRARDCNALQDLELACLCFFLTLSLAVTYAYRGIDGLENINKYTIFWTSGGYALAASFLVLSLSNLLINRKISSFLHFSGQSRRILSALLVAVLVAIYLFLSPAGQGVGMRSSSVEDLSHYISDLKQ